MNIIAEEFGVSFERASNVAALSQAGYAVGLAFVCPIADMVPRRPFILSLIFMTAIIVSALSVIRIQDEANTKCARTVARTLPHE